MIPVIAYLDAGSGALLLQLIVGGAAGVAAFVKYRWHSLTGRGKSDSDSSSVTEDAAVATQPDS